MSPTQNEIPAWIRIPAGIVLSLVILLCVAGSITIFIDPPEKNPVFAIFAGSLLILASLWGLDKSVRMVFGLRREGGLVSRRTLHVVSFTFLLLPIAGIFTGYYSGKGVIGILQAICMIGAFFGIRSFARPRK